MEQLNREKEVGDLSVQFENKYEVTKSLLKSWRKLSQKRSGKHRLWFAFSMKLFLGFFAVFCLIIALLFNAPTFITGSILYAFLLVFSLALPSIFRHRQFKNFAKISGETAWVQTIRFGENIEVQSGNSTTTYSYDKIRFIDENEECFYLWVGASFSMVIYKNSFSVGNDNDFDAFIKEKCSEQEPLWTKRELNKHVLKKSLPSILLIVLIVGIFLYTWSPVLPSNNVSQIVSERWGTEIQTITIVELPSSAVAFGTDGTTDYIYATLLRKSANHYTYVNSHAYPITYIDNANRENFTLFESSEEYLSFGYGKGTIVYGVANADWWDDNVAESLKQKYTVFSFKYGDTKFVLYYRIL